MKRIVCDRCGKDITNQTRIFFTFNWEKHFVVSGFSQSDDHERDFCVFCWENMIYPQLQIVENEE